MTLWKYRKAKQGSLYKSIGGNEVCHWYRDVLCNHKIPKGCTVLYQISDLLENMLRQNLTEIPFFKVSVSLSLTTCARSSHSSILIHSVGMAIIMADMRFPYKTGLHLWTTEKGAKMLHSWDPPTEWEYTKTYIWPLTLFFCLNWKSVKSITFPYNHYISFNGPFHPNWD